MTTPAQEQAEMLRFAAYYVQSVNGWAWATAIDMLQQEADKLDPPSIVTDEMVEEVRVGMLLNPGLSRQAVRATLKAAERLGYLRKKDA